MANDMYRLLLESLASGGAGLNGNFGKIQELLAQGDHRDQITNLITQYLANKQALAQIESEEEDPDLLLDSAEQQSMNAPDAREEKKERTLRLREKFRQMRSELLALRERNDLLAEALGACYLCWGEYPDCQECQGRGTPGSRPPNRELFKQWVSPALSRLQARNGVNKNDSSGGRSAPERE